MSMTAGLYDGATFSFLLTIPPSYPFHGELVVVIALFPLSFDLGILLKTEPHHDVMSKMPTPDTDAMKVLGSQ